MTQYIKFACVSILLLVATGCATNRGVVDIGSKPVVNPPNGKEIKFVRVTDKRDFQVDPKQANIPSLKNDEIDNEEITSRAIARKRNTFGKALGDILLPEGKTVMGVVKNTLAQSFSESGYRVVSQGDPGFDDATPIAVDIEKFWGWFSPGFWSIGLNFQTEVKVVGPSDTFKEGIVFSSDVQKRFQTAVSGNWKEVIDLSLRKLNDDIKAKLQKVEAAGGSSQAGAQ